VVGAALRQNANRGFVVLFVGTMVDERVVRHSRATCWRTRRLNQAGRSGICDVPKPQRGLQKLLGRAYDALSDV